MSKDHITKNRLKRLRRALEEDQSLFVEVHRVDLDAALLYIDALEREVSQSTTDHESRL